MSKDEVEYRTLLRTHLVSLVEQKSLGFSELVKLSAGAYPSIVKDVLNDLLTSEQINEYEGLLYSSLKTNNSTRLFTEKKENSKSVYFDPHPAEYDWRFTPGAIQYLVEQASEYFNERSEIALFGTTSLFLPLIEKRVNPTLYNKSAFLIEELKSKGIDRGLIAHDLFDPINGKNNHFDIVIADPPWYSDFYKAFILRASEVLKYDGLMFLSLFPWLTRPRAIAEREEINQFALSAGFDIYKIEPGVLTYTTPRFETASLNFEGIHLDGDWRSSDLFLLRKVRNPDNALVVKKSEHESEWDEFLIGNRRVKLKKREDNESQGFSFQNVDDGKILKSVSRRSSLRKNIDLWTSKNEAFSVNGIGLLQQALKFLEQGHSPDDVIKILKIGAENPLKGIDKLSELLRELTIVD